MCEGNEGRSRQVVVYDKNGQPQIARKKAKKKKKNLFNII